MIDISVSFFLATLAGFLILYYIFRREEYFEKYGIPHPKPFSILGNMVPILQGKFTFAEYISSIYNYNKESKYTGFHQFKSPVIIIRDLDLIKTITIEKFEHFVDHQSLIDPAIEPLFGNNLFALHGDEWRKMRALVSAAFTSSKMKSMFKLMSDCSSTFINSLVEKFNQGQCEFDSKDIFTRYANDTIATCAFGISVDSMENPDNDFYVLGRKAATFDTLKYLRFFMVQTFPTISKLLGVKVTQANVEKFFYDMVRDTIAARDEKGIHRPDMIQIMMETRNNKGDSKKPEFSIESATSQAFIFFLGGFESTSSLLCFAAHELAAHSEIQEKLQNEIDQISEKCDGHPTYEDINSMQYLDAVINEVLRLWPAPGFTDRVCTKNCELPPALVGSKPFPAKVGQHFLIPVLGIHRDPQYFPDPDTFIPERFIGDAKDRLNMSAYLPFGIGPRMCIGNRFALLETKVLFFNLFAKCNIKLAKKMIHPIRLDRKSAIWIAEGGFWLDIQLRNSM